jgi:Bacterial PH domain
VIRQVFRPTLARLLSAVIAAICAIGPVLVGIETGLSGLLRSAPWFVLVGGSCWALFWRPCVIVDDSGVQVVNVFRTIHLPWPSINAVDTKWALRLYTAYGRYTAWAAPAPSVHEVLRASHQDAAHLPDDTYAADGIRLGDLPTSPSGNAALMIRRRWQELRGAGHLENPRLERERPVVTWHTGTMAVGVAMALLALLALVI